MRRRSTEGGQEAETTHAAEQDRPTGATDRGCMGPWEVTLGRGCHGRRAGKRKAGWRSGCVWEEVLGRGSWQDGD